MKNNAVYVSQFAKPRAAHRASRIGPALAFERRRALVPLIGGALVGLVMIAMIGKGVTSGIATSTEVSAFAVAYALIVGGLAFRELSVGSVLRLFVRSAPMAGSILFIVAAASSVSYALTIRSDWVCSRPARLPVPS